MVNPKGRRGRRGGRIKERGKGKRKKECQSLGTRELMTILDGECGWCWWAVGRGSWSWSWTRTSRGREVEGPKDGPKKEIRICRLLRSGENWDRIRQALPGLWLDGLYLFGLGGGGLGLWRAGLPWFKGDRVTAE